MCMLSRFSLVQLSATLWTVACQAPLPMVFSRQEYWSESPCPPPGDVPNPGFKSASLMSPALGGGFFTIPWTEKPGRLQSLESQSQTRLSDFTFTFHFHALEKEMATHSSVLAWRIPGTAEPCGLPSMGSHRVGHDWSDLAAAAATWKAQEAWGTITVIKNTVFSK